MIILGIDPGTIRTGYGLVHHNGTKIRHIDNGVIAPDSKLPLEKRLEIIFRKLTELILSHSPSTLALEDVFVAKNVQSSLKLGHARGVVMLAAATHQLELYTYPATQVKQAITSFGRATKEQMQKMIRLHLNLPEIAQEDATDALAVAICHCQTRRWR